MTGRVYTSPDEPGAPQIGDLVVMARYWIEDDRPDIGLHTFLYRRVSLVTNRHRDGHYIIDHRWIVHSARWPTPAELAAYQLSQGIQP